MSICWYLQLCFGSMHIQLEAFQGPFDLLFNLIEKSEIDIYDIPMAQLIRQYLDAIRKIPPDMEGMSEFLVMAATLLEIKSRMLLPKPKCDNGEDEEAPLQALVRQLIAYKHCQQLAEALKNVAYPGQRIFKKPEYPLMIENTISRKPEEWLDNVTEEQLWSIFTDVVQRQALKVDTVRQNFGKVSKEIYTVSDKIKWILDCLVHQSLVRMSELFVTCKTREECVATFLALLEMIKMRQVLVRQKDVFGEIEVMLCQTCS